MRKEASKRAKEVISLRLVGIAILLSVFICIIFYFVAEKNEISMSPISPPSILSYNLNPTAYYTFDGNCIDQSNEGLNCESSGGVVYEDIAGLNTVANFSSVPSSVILPVSTKLNITHNLTISAWVYPTVVSGMDSEQVIIIRQRNNSLTYYNVTYGLFLTYDGDFRFKYVESNKTTLTTLTSSSTLPSDEWVFVTLTRDSDNNKVRLYVNGQLSREVDSEINFTDSGGLQLRTIIGNTSYVRTSSGDGYLTRNFRGNIDELAIFSSCLNETNIFRIYNNSRSAFNYIFGMPLKFSLNTPRNGNTIDGDSFIVNFSSDSDFNQYVFLNYMNSLMGWWTMDNIDGTLIDGNFIVDESKNSRNATRSNGVINLAKGKFGNYLFFNNYFNINMGDLDSLDGLTNLTISLWFNTTQSFNGALISKYNLSDPQNSSFYIGIGGNSEDNGISNNFIFRVVNTSGTSKAVNFVSPELSDGKWHNLVAILNGTHISLFIDGEYKVSKTFFGGIHPNSYPLRAGKFTVPNDMGGYFVGGMDEIIMFNRSLYSDEIKSIYDSLKNKYYHNFTQLSDGNYSFSAHGKNSLNFISSTGTRVINVSMYNVVLNIINDRPKDNSAVSIPFEIVVKTTKPANYVEYDFGGQPSTRLIPDNNLNRTFRGIYSRSLSVGSGPYTLVFRARDTYKPTIITKTVSSISIIPEENIGNCKELNYSGLIYTLIQDIYPSVDEVCFNVSADNVTLDGGGHIIYMNNRESDVDLANYGIVVRNVRNFTLRNIYIYNGSIALALFNSSSSKITKSRFAENGIGISLEGSNGLQINKNSFFNNSFSIIAYNNSNLLIDNNSWNYGEGAVFSNYGRNLNFTNLSISNTFLGLLLDNSINNKIDNLTFNVTMFGIMDNSGKNNSYSNITLIDSVSLGIYSNSTGSQISNIVLNITNYSKLNSVMTSELMWLTLLNPTLSGMNIIQGSNISLNKIILQNSIEGINIDSSSVKLNNISIFNSTIGISLGSDVTSSSHFAILNNLTLYGINSKALFFRTRNILPHDIENMNILDDPSDLNRKDISLVLSNLGDVEFSANLINGVRMSSFIGVNRSYNFSKVGGLVNASVYYPDFVKVEFGGVLNGSGDYLSHDIILANNSAYVNSSQILLNVSAKITFYNNPTRMNSYFIARDGILCPSNVCYNFTALNASTVIFNVTGWSNYSIVWTGPDMVYPVISGVGSERERMNTTDIYWRTSESANCTIRYGNKTYDLYLVLNDNLSISGLHQKRLTNLEKSLTYYYQLVCSDGAGLTSVTGIYNFTTLSSDPVKPTSSNGGGESGSTGGGGLTISGVSVNSITTNSALVIWNTNLLSSSWVDYGKSITYSNRAGSSIGGFGHAVQLSGLTPGTLYHYRVVSNASLSRNQYSSDRVFVTLSESSSNPIPNPKPEPIGCSCNKTVYCDEGCSCDLDCEKDTPSSGRIIFFTGLFLLIFGFLIVSYLIIQSLVQSYRQKSKGDHFVQSRGIPHK